MRARARKGTAWMRALVLASPPRARKGTVSGCVRVRARALHGCVRLCWPLEPIVRANDQECMVWDIINGGQASLMTEANEIDCKKA